MIRKYKKNDFCELLRMRCLLYSNHSMDELNNELTAFLHNPHSNDFINYDLWTSFVYQRENFRLGGFIDIGFIYADTFKQRLIHFDNTEYFSQIQQRLSLGLSIPVVESWYVDENLRGKHIGTQLMLHAEQWVKNNCCPFILSDTDDFRDISKKAHASFGYNNYHIDGNRCHYFYKAIK